MYDVINFITMSESRRPTCMCMMCTTTGADLPSLSKNDQTVQNFVTDEVELVWPDARVPYHLKNTLSKFLIRTHR